MERRMDGNKERKSRIDSPSPEKYLWKVIHRPNMLSLCDCYPFTISF